ncbi:MAG: aspartate aminotransferase [Gammaproteobacteria bacterium]|jgi:aspartate aminotransferase
MDGIRHIIQELPQQRIGAVSQLAFNDPDVIPLWFGEPDLDTPKFIQDTAIAAMRQGQTRYAHRRGIAPLRAAICDYLNGLYNVNLDSERITCFGSGMTAIMVATQTLLENGDNIVLVSPTWPNIFYCAYTLGAEPRHVRLQPQANGWQLDLDELADACDDRTRAIFVNSPSNPTGWVMQRDEQRALLDFARERGLWIIADEVYHRIVYEGKTVPSFLQIAEPDDRLYVVHSFSKAWCMTGWRCGFLVHPSSLGRQLGDLSGINNTGSATFVQHGAVAALTEGEEFVNQVVEHCRRGRDIVYQRLGGIEGVECIKPQAAFYAFFRIAGVGDDLAYAQDMVREARVGLAPGSAFGPGNEGYLRLCFAGDGPRLSEAMDRMQGFIESRR